MSYKVIVDAELRDLVPAYLEKRKAEVPELARLLAEGNFDVLRSAGHKLCGSGGGYGFDKISELGKALEAAAGAGNAAETKKLLLVLEDYLKNLEVLYQ